jgi:aspartokinase-like uncharacterized kinase
MTAIVRLGGSLARSGTLKDWLEPLASHGGGRVVLVPGGGVFADAVRDAQASDGFSDLAAHRMAILAMEQYGLMLADLEPRFRLAASEGEIAAALTAGAVALWLPSAMAFAAPEIAASWEVTSDSLAAWLARKIGARLLLLVKSAPAARPLDAAALAEQGLVDAAFPAYVAHAPFAWDYCGPGEQAKLLAAIAAMDAAPSGA